MKMHRVDSTAFLKEMDSLEYLEQNLRGCVQNEEMSQRRQMASLEKKLRKSELARSGTRGTEATTRTPRRSI